MRYILGNIYRKFRDLGKKPPAIKTFAGAYAPNLKIHPSSILKDESTIQFNPHFERGNAERIIIGKECLLTAHIVFETNEGKVTIGDNVYMGGVTLISKSGIKIGDNVTMAWGITIYDHDAHSTDWKDRQHDNQRCYDDYINHNGNLNVTKDWSVVPCGSIIIEDNVWIGFDVLILKGVRIGKGSVIAAKTVVTKDVPEWSLVAGNPAKLVKQLTRYEE